MEAKISAYIREAQKTLEPLVHGEQTTKEPTSALWNRPLAETIFKKVYCTDFFREYRECLLYPGVKGTFFRQRRISFPDCNWTIVQTLLKSNGITYSEVHQSLQKIRFIQDVIGVSVVLSEKAVYSADPDKIRLPWILTFRSWEAFWHTFFHELGHFTGGHNRLRSYLYDQGLEQRKRSSPESGKEEAIAELVAMTMTHLFLRKNQEFRRTQQIGIRYVLRFLNNIPKEERRDKLEQAVLEAKEACLFVFETMPLLPTLFV